MRSSMASRSPGLGSRAAPEAMAGAPARPGASGAAWGGQGAGAGAGRGAQQAQEARAGSAKRQLRHPGASLLKCDVAAERRARARRVFSALQRAWQPCGAIS